MGISMQAGYVSPYTIFTLAVFPLMLACVTSMDGGHMYQFVTDCEYSNDSLDDMVYLVKNVFNKRMLNIYDSRVKRYVGFDEFGIKNADHYNSQKWKMALRQVEVETICKYSARLFSRSTLERRVPPSVKVSTMGTSHYGVLTVLECRVMGFYPQDIRVTWMRDGAETTTDVTSTDILANGDWTYQLHSYLELRPRRGERVSCRVEHSSLGAPLEVSWDVSALDSRVRKVASGVCSLVLGLTVAAGGGLYYGRKRRGFFLVPFK